MMGSVPQYTAGGVLLFPISFSTGLSRHLSLSLLFAILSVSVATTAWGFHSQEPAESVAPTTLVGLHELRLQNKAEKVLERFTSQGFAVDISVVLDHSRVKISSYTPGETPKILTSRQETSDRYDESVRANQDSACKDKSESMNKHKKAEIWELTGVWKDTVDDHPRISKIECCVTIFKADEVDEDHLYRCLSASLGIDLRRGDVLKIVSF